MGIFKGGISQAISGVIGAVTGGASNLLGTVVGSATGVLKQTGETLSTALPAVTNLANSPAGAGALGALIGKPVTSGTIVSAGAKGNNDDTIPNDGVNGPLTGFKKFFCYKKLKDGFFVDDNGNKVSKESAPLDVTKIVIHSIGALTIIGAVYLIGKKQRWF